MKDASVPQRMSKRKTSDSSSNTFTPSQGRKHRQKLITSLLEDFKEEEFKHLITDQVKLENFEILKVIGRGAFAKIYLVKKHIEGSSEVQYYALKVLKKKQLYEKR
jgi:hypothetical protein